MRFGLDPPVIFALQVTFMNVVNVLVARRYVVPWLARRPLAEALSPLLLLHATRVIGLGFLTANVTDPNLPAVIAVPAAYGDLLAATLALVAYAALRYELRSARALVWVMNVVGLADLVHAAARGIALGFADYRLGPMWFVPTFIGPTMIVTHALMFWLLVRRA
jgi:hypothetical protein